MSVPRPTFHEAWYRVAQLRPRLLLGVQVHRQHFRGQLWYVLENPSNNQFFRVSEEAYQFVARLDGRRTVSEAWHICNEQLGDNAPTQGEVIQLLGQLHSANLLHSELAPDTESLFNRYRKRIRKQVEGYVTNVLFIRVPLIDPDHFLDRWVGVFGRLFSWFGLILWSLLLTTGLWFAIGNAGELVDQSSNVLAPSNLILLYLSFVLVKTFHEFSHAFACKKFGRLNRNGGQVHTMGIMFLVFFPLPYLDASSAWAFRKKWHRVVVGMSGIMVELAIAAIAAIVWAHTSPGTVHAIAYNVIFVASISTVLFNGNPLLRFDAYYALSDLVEVPNLSPRSRSYFYYLVKRYCWGLRQAASPAHILGERIWFVFFGISSTAYRIFIYIRILLFLNNRLPEELFILVPVLAFSAIVAWVVVPLGKFLRYLATSSELARKRLRAVASTLGALGITAACLGALPVPDYCRVEGIVEPVHLALVHAATDGFVQEFLSSGAEVSPDGSPLIRAANPELDTERKSLLLEHQSLETRRRLSESHETAAAQAIDEQIAALDEQIQRVEAQISSLDLHAPVAGTWVSPDIERIRGAYVRRGQRIGLVASPDGVLIRATAGQEIAAMLVEQAYQQLEIRVKGRPEPTLTGTIERILPSGHELLPSAALGYAIGGSTPTVPQDPRGIVAAERFFEIRIRPNTDDSIRLLTGQRVVARIQLPPKPLAVQLWRSVRQLFQRRFQI